MIQIVESPRDAMQGISKFISTKKKIDYINSLLKVGYHTIDFGSFVSPKFITLKSHAIKGCELNMKVNNIKNIFFIQLTSVIVVCKAVITLSFISHEFLFASQPHE